MNKIKVPYLEELKLYLSQRELVLKDCGRSTSVFKSDSDGSLNISDFLTTSSEDIYLSSKKNQRVHFSHDKENNFFEQLKRTIEKLDPLEPGIESVWRFDAFDFSSLTSSTVLEEMQPSENLQDKQTNECKSLTLNIFYADENEKVNDPTIINFIPVEIDSALPKLEMRLFFDLEKHKNLFQNKNLDLIVKNNNLN